MKIIHISDLHFGKTIDGLSLVAQGDQEYWIDEFLKLVDKEKPQAVLVAGDVYDRTMPSAEATALLDKFLTELSGRKVPVLLIAGNHDSGKKLAFAKDLLSRENIGIHIVGEVSEKLDCIKLEDEYGPVNFWMLPYVYPAMIQSVLGEKQPIGNYDASVRKLLEKQDIDRSQRNVILAHQNVTVGGNAMEFGGSETVVGSVGQIDVSVFDAFDYVALGHIHAAYKLGREGVRYCGSPLCYHFDEVSKAKKGPLVVEIGEKKSEDDYAELTVECREIGALHPLRVIEDTYSEVRRQLEEELLGNEYLKIVITDQRMTPEIGAYCRSLCESKGCKVLGIRSSFSEYKELSELEQSGGYDREKTPEAYFTDFYRERMTDEDPAEEDLALFDYIGELVSHHISKGESVISDKDAEDIIDFITKQ